MYPKAAFVFISSGIAAKAAHGPENIVTRCSCFNENVCLIAGTHFSSLSLRARITGSGQESPLASTCFIKHSFVYGCIISSVHAC